MRSDCGQPAPAGSATTGFDDLPGVSAAVAASAAATAFAGVSTTAPTQRRRWLEAVAEALHSRAELLVALAEEETGLGEVRLRQELTDAAANARYYAAVGEGGGWLRAQAQRRTGGSAADLRKAHLSIGPVAVFGASNFPFKFGVFGHDTCAAVAAGCSVVVKAHPAHPRLSRAIAGTVTAALDAAGAPAGTFGLIEGFTEGLALVQLPEIAAVAFTGSQSGGMALVDAVRARPLPIPVFAEMGTVNPVVVTPGAAHSIEPIAAGFVESFTRGGGQFCTKPGLLLVPRGCGAAAAIAAALSSRDGVRLLTAGISDAFRAGVGDLVAAGAEVLATGGPADGEHVVRPVALSVSPDVLRQGSRLLQECFGPVGLVAEYGHFAEVGEILSRMQPALAGSVFSADGADPDVSSVVAQLAGRTGRVVVNDWPTGVACVDAMHHGGPWPATSRPDATSVGADALARFTRPVAFQNVPDEALPPALQDANPWRLVRYDQEGRPW
ncbi:aldehyde dehydrogenase family protein [Dactylosporangium roseum]|uniref:Aldehyde dehydrogenase family protein n=1 Tax=Dactylosporangium roseum TaxID=47989 RepID=A0ABY5Z1A8_9ACTN|nr:aldehyde dehydrogenase family protein [Dactylosporangium roseum]UWZ34632.1 aldehyde dehydrogenase family protein [Dactylosporangium roseum]